jgi:hypothetical protein
MTLLPSVGLSAGVIPTKVLGFVVIMSGLTTFVVPSLLRTAFGSCPVAKVAPRTEESQTGSLPCLRTSVRETI